ncbi:CDP-alcohol phosphatidyltransferase family protein [Butyrivibrio sp. MC2013]|uniref:CDP-alcohol phosphatidyltransferase family protein n=1 Tax=Butyrivibrio sp. MC2013 TaxID=1280686 RepID=UPI00042403CE|nr:CDP-alcohol phosphatidyltransferase family protein [Butyrivibrio sp. MC2013]
MRTTVKEIKDKAYTRKKQIQDRSNPFVYYLYRPTSHYLVKFFLLFDCSPTFVTWLSLVPLLIGIPLIAFSTSVVGRLFGGGMFLIWIVLDCVDGTMARFTGKTSKYGDLIDGTVGYIALWGFPLAVGMAAYSDRMNSLFDFDEDFAICIFLGGLQAVFSIFPRLVMHKKYQGTDPKDNSFQNREQYSVIASLGVFIMDCQGLPVWIFFVSVLLHTINIMVYLYSLVYVLFFVVVMYKLLKPEQG